MAKIFVANFNFAITEDKLKEFFSKVGEVLSVKIMTEPNGGKSRGFGFVEFATAEEAKKAVDDLNGANFDGRTIKVSEDNSKQSGGQASRKQNNNSQNRGSSNYSGRSTNSAFIKQQVNQQAMGYFKAQPLDLGLKKKRRQDPFVEDPTLKIDYKNPKVLSRFMSERGKILSRRMTGLTASNQRLLTVAIRRAQQLALLPIVNN